MIDKDVVTVYWAPSPYTDSQQSWMQLYPEPVSLVSELQQIRNKNIKGKDNKSMFACPAYIETMKNVFVIKAPIDDTIPFAKHCVFKPAPPVYPFYLDDISKLRVTIPRESSLDGYTNIAYNLGWLLFADEPLTARFTAPYFPTVAPAEGAMLAAGEFDIGSWYRDYEIEYHVPNNVEELTFKEGQPLCYVEFKTDKKIVLKRYSLNNKLRAIADECAESRYRYGGQKSLLQRYTMSKKALLPQQVLTEIKKNLIE